MEEAAAPGTQPPTAWALSLAGMTLFSEYLDVWTTDLRERACFSIAGQLSNLLKKTLECLILNPITNGNRAEQGKLFK